MSLSYYEILLCEIDKKKINSVYYTHSIWTNAHVTRAHW